MSKPEPKLTRGLLFPFAKSIKITTTPGDQYFQVSVTTLPQDTKVESYPPEVLKRARSVQVETQRALLNPPLHHPNSQGRLEHHVLVQIPAGQSADLLPEDWSGGHPGAIETLACRVDAADRTRTPWPARS